MLQFQNDPESWVDQYNALDIVNRNLLFLLESDDRSTGLFHPSTPEPLQHEAVPAPHRLRGRRTTHPVPSNMEIRWGSCSASAQVAY